MKETIKVGCLQHSFKNTTEETINFVIEKIKKMGQEGIQILCLQELFTGPYFCQNIENDNFKYAFSDDSPIFEEFKKLSKEYKMVLIIPFFEKTIEGLYFNSAFVIDADGNILGKYRKTHIPEDPCFYEKYYFSEGDSGYLVFNTLYGKISVLICWDQWFPEAARIVSLMGAQIIFYPSAIGILKGEENQENNFKNAWITVQRASAIQNGVFVCSVNRTGRENNIDFWGSSFICSPIGEILSGDYEREEAEIKAEISLSLLNETRVTWPFFRDRRVDTYQNILKRSL